MFPQFGRNRGHAQQSFSRTNSNRAGKSFPKRPRTSFTTMASNSRYEQMFSQEAAHGSEGETGTPQTSPPLTSAIVTISVGRHQRLFAAHEDVLSVSPFFASLCENGFYQSTHRIELPNDEPEIFSCVLEFLYKGDYYPRMEYDRRRRSYMLENAADPSSRASTVESTVWVEGVETVVLKDTVIYCVAQKYGLPELQKLAIRKQGLQSGIQVSTILSSARYAYANTPDSDSRLRAHYLALIIRSRQTFKRSGTMQMEMECGGKLFFDLFVAMSNHIDELEK